MDSKEQIAVAVECYETRNMGRSIRVIRFEFDEDMSRSVADIVEADDPSVLLPWITEWYDSSYVCEFRLHNTMVSAEDDGGFLIEFHGNLREMALRTFMEIGTEWAAGRDITG